MSLKTTKRFTELYNQLIQESVAEKKKFPALRLGQATMNTFSKYFKNIPSEVDCFYSDETLPKYLEYMFYEAQMIEILIQTLDLFHPVESYVQATLGNREFPNDIPPILKHALVTRLKTCPI